MIDSSGNQKSKGFIAGAPQRAKERARRAKLAQALRDEANLIDLAALHGPHRAIVREAIRELVIPALDEAQRKRTDVLILPRISKRSGRPKKSLLALEIMQLHREGIPHGKIAQRLNHKHGKETATSESVRKCLFRYLNRTKLSE